jgi:hypothetical protein
VATPTDPRMKIARVSRHSSGCFMTSSPNHRQVGQETTIHDLCALTFVTIQQFLLEGPLEVADEAFAAQVTG